MTYTPTHDQATEHKIARAEFLKRLLILLTFLLGLTSLCGVAVLFAKQTQTIEEIRATQQQGSPVILRLEDLTQTIQSCVTPGQPCYDASQKRTAAAVASINDTVAAAIACADRLGQQSLPQINACVIDTLNRKDTTP